MALKCGFGRMHGYHHVLKNRFFLFYITLLGGKGAFVRMVLSTTPLNVAFRRSFLRVNLKVWHKVVAMVLHVQLTNQRDHFPWELY